ncbi:MAG: amidohydrolase family protein [Armatimonadetes bacterium]|nr:amidohydrolase family protein [Armatimonadota bacterium]
MMVVDTHLHWYLGKETHDPETLVNSGVLNRVWMLSGNAIVAGQATDEDVLGLHRKHPDFFVPFAWLEFEKGPQIVDDFHARGFKGLKAQFPAHPYDNESYFPFYERAERYGMPIVFHTGGSLQWPFDFLPLGEGHPERTTAKHMTPTSLDLVAKTFRGLKIIAAHMGGWRETYSEGLTLLRNNPNCYLDNSACHPDMLRDALKVMKPTRFLNGSDGSFPQAVERAVFFQGYFKYVIGDVKAGELVLGINAERLLAEAQAHASSAPK